MSEAPPRSEACGNGPLPPKADVTDEVAVARVGACPAGRGPAIRQLTDGSQSRATEAVLQPLDATLRRWASNIREEARAAVFGSLPRIASVGLEIESRRLRFTAIPQLFARDLERLSPTLNDDVLELYGRSEQVLANRFAFFGETEEFGSSIAWEGPHGVAWQTQLHSFDFALDLALTFRISGDERYGRHLRYLTADWIAANPPGRTAGWQSLALSRRIRVWILASDLARKAFEAQADFLALFTASLAQQVTYLAWAAHGLEDRHAQILTSRALLLASRYFSGSRATELGEIARSRLVRAVEDGSGSFPDHPQPLRQFELAAACADHALFADEAGWVEWAKEHFRISLEALEGMLHPDGALPLFGREPLPLPDAITALFALGAAMLGVPSWKNLAGGELGILPYMLLGEAGKRRFNEQPQEPWRAESRLQTESGIYRLGDGESSALLISAIPLTSPPGHHDFFSYELTVCGQRTVIDSGIPAPASGRDDDGLAAAIHHNVLLVEGRPPRVFSIPGVHSVPVEGQAGFQGLWLSWAWDDGKLPPSAEKSCVMPLLHQRGYFLIADRFWVVLDHLTGTGANQVESILHFYPTFSLEVQDGQVLVRSGAASVAIHPLASGASGAAYTCKLKAGREGWYAPSPGTRYPTQTLCLEWKQVMLPGVFGYVMEDAEGAGTSAGCSIAVSGAKVRLTLHGAEFSIKIPGGLRRKSGE